MIKKVQELKSKAEKKEKVDFYEGVIQSLTGIIEYLENMAKLACKRREQCTPTERNNIENLTQVEKRLRNLATGPPTNFIEAAQLVYTLHTALHLIGEPVSVGRLDRLLGKFYENDLKKKIINQE